MLFGWRYLQVGDTIPSDGPHNSSTDAPQLPRIHPHKVYALHDALLTSSFKGEKRRIPLFWNFVDHGLRRLDLGDNEPVKENLPTHRLWENFL